MPVSFVKSFGKSCGVTVLTNALSGPQISIFLLRSLWLRYHGVKSRPFTVAVGFRRQVCKPPFLFIVYLKWI